MKIKFNYYIFLIIFCLPFNNNALGQSSQSIYGKIFKKHYKISLNIAGGVQWGSVYNERISGSYGHYTPFSFVARQDGYKDGKGELLIGYYPYVSAIFARNIGWESDYIYLGIKGFGLVSFASINKNGTWEMGSMNKSATKSGKFNISSNSESQLYAIGALIGWRGPKAKVSWDAMFGVGLLNVNYTKKSVTGNLDSQKKLLLLQQMKFDNISAIGPIVDGTLKYLFIDSNDLEMYFSGTLSLGILFAKNVDIRIPVSLNFGIGMDYNFG